MKIAFLFPGQGMEEARMGLQAIQGGIGRALIDRAEAAAQAPLRRFLVEGGPSFSRTENLQPLIAAVCLALWAQLDAAGVRPALCVGHSLGELLAWSAAGGASAEVTVELAALRGRLMAREANRRPGGMLALTDADAEQIEAALRLGRQHGELSLAAVNAPRQAVLSGDLEALSAVARDFAGRRLPVSGAWHGAAMAGAQEELRQALHAAASPTLRHPIVSGVSAQVIHEAAAMPELLAQQLTRPVRWTEVLATVADHGVTDYVTIGPGRVMRDLLRKVLGDRVRVHGAFDTDEAAQTAQRLGSWGLGA